MKKFSISYTFSQGVRGIAKSIVMSLASMLVLASCLTVLGAYGLLTANFSENLNDMALQNEIAVFVRSDCTEDELTELRTSLQALCDEGLAEGVTYVSKEEALISEMEKYRDYPLLFETLQGAENPYRASFVLNYRQGISVTDLENRLKSLTIVRSDESSGSELVYPIETVTSHVQAANAMNSVKKGITRVALVALFILFLVSICTIVSTVRLSIFARRDEISVMRYVGATNAFIKSPFVCEGALIGILSALIAFLAEWALYEKVSEVIGRSFRMFSVIPFQDVWFYLLAGSLAVGLFAGILAGAVAVSRYIKESQR